MIKDNDNEKNTNENVDAFKDNVEDNQGSNVSSEESDMESINITSETDEEVSYLRAPSSAVEKNEEKIEKSEELIQENGKERETIRKNFDPIRGDLYPRGSVPAKYGDDLFAQYRPTREFSPIARDFGHRREFGPPHMPRREADWGFRRPPPMTFYETQEDGTKDKMHQNRMVPTTTRPPSTLLDDKKIQRLFTHIKPPIPKHSFFTQRKTNTEFDATDAMSYLNKVKDAFKETPTIYDSFLEVMKDYKHSRIDPSAVVKAVTTLFKSNINLLEGFNNFLPTEFKINFSKPNHIPQMKQPISTSHPSHPSIMYHQPPNKEIKKVSVDDDEQIKQDMATDYISKVRSRLFYNKAKYKNFIEVLQSYQKKQIDVNQVVMKLKVVLEGHKDLMDDFLKFIPENKREVPEEKRILNQIKNILVDKNIYKEFLKALNLFNQDLLPAKDLMFFLKPLIKDQTLLDCFKEHIKYDEINLPPNDIKNLSKYKKVGSYRILPEKYRDIESNQGVLEKEVLNNFCVSCPMFNSEEDNFTIHRRSVYEEALCRVEDEKYEAELNLERVTNLIISLELMMDTLSKNEQFEITVNDLRMSAEIVEETLSYIYEEKSEEIFEDVLSNPKTTIPIVLKRLYSISKVWRKQIREKQKVWREVYEKNYYRALDIQGVEFKTAQKKNSNGKKFQINNEEDIDLEDNEIIDFIIDLFSIMIQTRGDGVRREKRRKIDERINNDDFKMFVNNFKIFLNLEKLDKLISFNFSIFLKTFASLYNRIKNVKENCTSELKSNKIAVELGLQKEIESQGRYNDCLDAMRKYILKEIDTMEYEEEIRIFTETKGYDLFLINKQLEKLEKEIITIMKENEIDNILSSDYILKDPVYTLKKDHTTIHLSKINTKDQFDEYVKCFLDMNVDNNKIKDKVFLNRNKKNIPTDSLISYKMEFKICRNSYKLKYVDNKEDFVMNKKCKRGDW
ncbi:Histone deacetylase domain containing protein [Spraguea lophii 42_110]|uniref:Histone deacetylase domain containing protein n=1 Tax=Spraguea lophii (strain 42_110) TaxID=1358809 RepID=S7XUM7_SPRLO|nr:Histone deacetylase domain containing protein [Spraguea lophii 42_110]